MNLPVSVGDKVYVVEDMKCIWGFIVSVDKVFVGIQWEDKKTPMLHNKHYGLTNLTFVPEVGSLEDKIKELLG